MFYDVQYDYLCYIMTLNYGFMHAYVNHRHINLYIEHLMHDMAMRMTPLECTCFGSLTHIP